MRGHAPQTRGNAAALQAARHGDAQGLPSGALNQLEQFLATVQDALTLFQPPQEQQQGGDEVVVVSDAIVERVIDAATPAAAAELPPAPRSAERAATHTAAGPLGAAAVWSQLSEVRRPATAAARHTFCCSP